MRELELYVHIPFCIRKCAYCDFLSGPADEVVRQKYVDALKREISGKQKAHREYSVSSVFVGGGTPSVLTAGQITGIFRALRESFQIREDAEITMEVNPGTVTEEKISAWKEAGVNRISVGLQSADNRELKLLGRIHDYGQFLDTWDRIRRAGFCNVNIDLISAIPGQTLESWSQTLHKVAELGPEHLSAYSLIIEEGTLFYEWYGRNKDHVQKKEKGAGKDAGRENGAGISWDSAEKTHREIYPALPDEEEERLIYEETEQILKTYGYTRYEISNYAKEGYECRHNIGYWTRKEYLGLGPGASSFLEGIRFQNVSDLQEYEDRIEKGKSLQTETERLTAEDAMGEFMFLGLRMMCGVRKSEFYRLFGVRMEEIYRDSLKMVTAQGMAVEEGDVVRLTRKGIDLSNYVFEQFLLL